MQRILVVLLATLLLASAVSACSGPSASDSYMKKQGDLPG